MKKGVSGTFIVFGIDVVYNNYQRGKVITVTLSQKTGSQPWGDDISKLIVIAKKELRYRRRL